MDIKTVVTTFKESSDTSAVMDQGGERRVNARAATDSDSMQSLPQKKTILKKK